MITELIYRVFETRNESHLAHWATKSYAEHVALNDFYDAVLGPLDDLVENYQACFGLVGKPTEEKEEKEEVNILSCLKDDVKFINKNRGKICKDIPALLNILDELQAVYLKTIYKLENLR
jgi:hypothetical protein